MDGEVSVKLPQELSEKLDRLSKSLDASKTSIVTQALTEFLTKNEGYQVAMGRLVDIEQHGEKSPGQAR